MPISYNIIEKKLKRKIEEGDIIEIDVDLVFAQDGTAGLAIEQLEKINKKRKIFSEEKVSLFIDHAAPSPRIELSQMHNKIREFAKEKRCYLFDIGAGISHQIIAEEFAKPGMIIVGADSHTLTAGALATLAIGMGSTDIACAMHTGKIWLKVPEVMLIEIEGEIEEPLSAKDVILYIIKKLRVGGANNKIIEFCGSGIEKMKIADRLTICNMCQELGAESAIMPADYQTYIFLKQHNREKDFKEINLVKQDYQQRYYFNTKDISLQIALPDKVDNVVDIEEIEGLEVDQIVIGTCTNGRLEDLLAAAKILSGKKINKWTRLIVIPASRKVYMEAIKAGVIEVLLSAGACICNPGCGPCVGIHQGVLSEGQVCLSTQNRNFKGRMGSPSAKIYLCSPQVAAASSITGKITHPKNLNKFMV